MVEVKLTNSRNAAQRIADRLKPSNDTETANVHAVHGTGPTRTHTTLHYSAGQSQHGTPDHGVGDISGNKR
jgi:hypothetical protein